MAYLTPKAQFIADMLAAVNRGTQAGVSTGEMADLMADTLADLRDLNDDSAWPERPPPPPGGGGICPKTERNCERGCLLGQWCPLLPRPS
jgi:hypothetical protein